MTDRTPAGGALGPLAPLIGAWRTDGAAGAGPGLVCTRRFARFGQDYVRLDADWDMGERGAYREIALFGAGEDGALAFWSFTSDGKRSTGARCPGDDVHADALAFSAQMPAGLARMVYWPSDAGDGFRFAVEGKTKAGWSRFVDHTYLPLAQD